MIVGATKMKMNKFFKQWKESFLLLSSIGISNIGAWIYFIALNLIILDMTRSAFAVSILYILKPLATLLTNFWSGSLIDRINKRNLMIGLDLIRAVFILLLPFISSLWLMYSIVLLINMAGSIFYPTSMIYMTKLVPEERRQRFNSFRSLIGSGAFVLGPSIAGLLFMIGTPTYAILINGISLIISGVISFYLPNIEEQEKHDLSNTKISFYVLKNDWNLVIKYSRTHLKMMLLFFLFYFIVIMTTTIDSLEAAFSKEVLHLSNTKYGFLVSIAGAGFVFGSLVNSIFTYQLKAKKLIGYGSIFLSIGYIIYAFSNEFIGAVIGFALLSFALAFSNTGFETYYQNRIPIEMMGRISSLFGLIQAFFVIFLTTLLGYLTNLFSLQIIVMISSIFLFMIAFILFVMIEFLSEEKIKDHKNQNLSY